MDTHISYISIGVADLAPVRRLWVDLLGLHCVASHQGADVELAALWGLDSTDISAQLVVATPGAKQGRLHFVELSQPGLPVRHGAATIDCCAKNIDVNCVDIDQVVQRLKKAGFVFRSPVAQYELDGVQIREVQFAAHDELNVVLIEVLSADYLRVMSAEGCAAVTSVVSIVPDVVREVEFFQSVLRLPQALHHQLAGPGLEAAAGLPAGTTLDLFLLGSPDNIFGRVELIQYIGAAGQNLFPRARPPATGILKFGIEVSSLARVEAVLDGLGWPSASSRPFSILPAVGRMLECASPAGIPLQIFAIESQV